MKAIDMGVNINITKTEYAFIDGSNGDELTPEQFNQRHNKLGLGGLGSVLQRGQVEAAEEENNPK